VLIEVHGGLASGSQWEPVVPELARGFRVITPDSRSHGRPTNPAGELSYARIADDIAALTAALGQQRPVVGGWRRTGRCSVPTRRACPIRRTSTPELGEFAEEIKALRPGGDKRWPRLGHDGRRPSALPVLASPIRDFARRHSLT
jgi:hypothetical protein